MALRRYHDGEVIFRKGEPCDAMYRVSAGVVLVERSDADGRTVGVTLHPGESFGEIGLLNGDERGGQARAVGLTKLDVLKRSELIEMLEFSADGGPPLIWRLFERSRAATPSANDNLAFGEAASAAPAPDLKMVLSPAGDQIAKAMGVDELVVKRLPFVVGRKSDERDRRVFGDVGVILPDEPPYKLSRRHFGIELREGDVVIRDYDSHHGTMVNGRAIGAKTRDSFATLHKGENEVIAGPRNSPFRFILKIEDA